MENLICQTFLNLCIFLITGCIGDITYFPKNAAVKVGGTAVFNCTSSLLITAWYLSRNGQTFGSSYEQITTYCNVSLGYSAHYKTEPLAGFQPTCNLIVLDATLQQAGVYVCSDGISANPNARALMTVVDSPPNITANQSDVVVGETLHVSCTIGYNGSVYPAPLLPPSIYWTSSTGENISSTLSPSPPPNSVESYILVSPDGSINSVGPFICHGYFEEPQNIDPGYATNAPTLSSSTTSENFQVFDGKFVEETSTCALGLEDWLCGLVLGIIIILSLNILALVAFLLYYGLSETGHRHLNDRFDKMEKMLPCMNKGRDCSGWVCLFGFLSILAGIVYLPVIVIMANFQKNKKTSQVAHYDSRAETNF